MALPCLQHRHRLPIVEYYVIIKRVSVTIFYTAFWPYTFLVCQLKNLGLSLVAKASHDWMATKNTHTQKILKCFGLLVEELPFFLPHPLSAGIRIVKSRFCNYMNNGCLPVLLRNLDLLLQHTLTARLHLSLMPNGTVIFAVALSLSSTMQHCSETFSPKGDSDMLLI